MLSIGKLTPGRVSYYLEQIPGGADEYYVQPAAEPGRWLGAAAGRLDLASEVTAEAFTRVLDAAHPASGERLGAPTTTAKRVAGFDLTLSAPKSVSVAWALAPPDIAEVIDAAHEQAVTDTISLLEAEAGRARRGAGGHRVVETEGVAAAGFTHRTSRAGDPQLHTHVVIANLTPDRDGRWTALDGTRVYRWAKTLGYSYLAALRANLTASLGVEWGPVDKGTANLAQLDQAVLEEFSRRRAQITAALGRDPQTAGRNAAQTATLATRPAKTDIDLNILRADWKSRAARHGVSAETILGLCGPGRTPDLDIDDHMVELLAPTGLTANQTGFDRRDIFQALAAAQTDGATITQLRDAADRIVAHPDVVALAGPGPAGDRYSTTELLAVERAMVHRARHSAHAARAVVPAADLGDVFDTRPSLSVEQQAMVTSLTTSGAGVEVVVGRAGAGKTYALDAARAAWQAAGHPVIGTALAARAAAELQAGAGIPSTTIDQLLIDLDRPGPLGGLAPNSVVVVDEAGMVGTRKLDRLLTHADRYEAKVVLVGDPRQLPEIEAGGALAALTTQVPVSRLVDNRRQEHAWEREALTELRAGSVEDAVVAYHQAGRITLAPSPHQARGRLVDDWQTAGAKGEHAVMYALRRADVDDLNRRARARLDAAGALGPERLTAAGREYATGDVVLCTRNDRRLGVTNGTTATVADIDPDKRTVTLDDGTTLPTGYIDAGHLTHGYATTVHKAQGATVDRAFVLGSETLYREAGYVALSRARHGSHLYLVDSDNPDPLAALTRQLQASRAQTLATNQIHPDRQPDAERALLADPPAWATHALGEPPLSGPDRARWAERASRLDDYRRSHDITDELAPIGPAPTDTARRRVWDLARIDLVDHQRYLTRDQGLSR